MWLEGGQLLKKEMKNPLHFYFANVLSSIKQYVIDFNKHYTKHIKIKIILYYFF